MKSTGKLELFTQIEHWPLVAPFRITGHLWEVADVLSVCLQRGGLVGHGEAAGVYYRNETPATMIKQVESVRTQIETGITRDSLQALLSPGGARNAVDCALWDLEAKLTGCPAWRIAGIEIPKPLRATFTCGADDPERMAAVAITNRDFRAFKLKLTGEPLDAERVRMVRQARTDAWVGVDANQGFSRAHLEKLMPVLLEARVALIEQPFPVGDEALLEGFQSPIPIVADESVQTLADISNLPGRFNVVNIKLDKCGGLTEGLAMARAASDFGLDTMIGNMLGTSLAMAPGWLLGQLCSVVDLDGPLLLRADRATPVRYTDGFISCPDSLWGHAAT